MTNFVDVSLFCKTLGITVCLILSCSNPIEAAPRSLKTCLKLLKISRQAEEPPRSKAVHRLFNEDGLMVANYEKLILNNLRPGDILSFNNGKLYEFVKKLDSGFTTMVLGVRNLTPLGKSALLALRLPIADKEVTNRRQESQHVSFLIDDYRLGYDLLKKHNLSIPKILDHLPQQYVAVEFIDYDFNGNDFFKRSEKIDTTVLLDAEFALLEFARDSSAFSHIGDFKPGQLVYNISKRKWTLLDWTSTHIMNAEVEQQDNSYDISSADKKATIFDHLFVYALSHESDDFFSSEERRLITYREHQLISRLRRSVNEERRKPSGSRRSLREKFKDILY